MANRRMFSKTIISSAQFIKMPPSSQMLYFHLGLNADDDGIVEAFTIMRMVGASEDDLKILAAKKFITILNDDLVTFINDWNEHNWIRKERKIDSKYKSLLVCLTSGSQMSGKCLTSDCQMSAEVRLGKVRLGKVSKTVGCKNATVTEFSNEFEEAWANYPKRLGSNSKTAAWKHWKARITEGVNPNDLLSATTNYRDCLIANGNINTPYVMQAQRFFGANKEYEQYIIINPEDLQHVQQKLSSASEQSRAFDSKLQEFRNKIAAARESLSIVRANEGGVGQ